MLRPRLHRVDARSERPSRTWFHTDNGSTHARVSPFVAGKETRSSLAPHSSLNPGVARRAPRTWPLRQPGAPPLRSGPGESVEFGRHGGTVRRRGSGPVSDIG